MRLAAGPSLTGSGAVPLFGVRHTPLQLRFVPRLLLVLLSAFPSPAQSLLRNGRLVRSCCNQTQTPTHEGCCEDGLALHPGPPFGCCDESFSPSGGPGSSGRPAGGNSGELHKLHKWEGEMHEFFLQLVGLQDGGIISPDSAYQLQDKPCLTVGKEDRNRGVGIYWHTCESENLGPMGVDPETGKPKRIHPLDPVVHDAQLFQFTKTGQIRHKGSGKCIRREKCGKFQYMYDLAPCDGVGSISVFAIKRPIAGEIDHLMAMGSPYQAVESDGCELCGPYFLYERCLSEGQPSHGAQGCIRGWQATPGWTNGYIHGQSQYVGDEATLGESSATHYPELTDKLNWRDQIQDQAEMSGVGQTEDDGLCGSFVTDQPVLNSVFYFHHQRSKDKQLI